MCKGGPSGNLCLVSLKTAGGFGNCVVLTQSMNTNTQTCGAAKGDGSGDGQMQRRELVVDPRAVVRHSFVVIGFMCLQFSTPARELALPTPSATPCCSDLLYNNVLLFQLIAKYAFSVIGIFVPYHTDLCNT